jgi:hypothetical protein
MEWNGFEVFHQWVRKFFELWQGRKEVGWGRTSCWILSCIMARLIWSRFMGRGNDAHDLAELDQENLVFVSAALNEPAIGSFEPPQ